MKMKKNKRIAISVILIAFAYGLNLTGISPILGILSEKYSQYGTSTVQLLQTIPYLLVMAGSLIVGWLTTKFAKKRIVTFGLLVIGICGIIPVFIDNFTLLFITRMLIGFGFGIVGPLNTAIIAEFFSARERVSYMGLHVVGMGIGNMVGNVLGGTFAGIGYNFFYLVYMIAFISVIGIQIFLIETPPVSLEKTGKIKLNRRVFVIAFSSFLHTLFINAYSTNIGIYILNKVTDNPTVPGLATGLNAAAALIVGLFFGKISRIFGKFTMPFSVFAAAVGYACLLFLGGMPGVCMASICCGISLSCFMASGSYLISISVKSEAVAKASGVFSIVGGIGGLIAPIFMGNVSAFVLKGDTAQNQFIVALAGMLIFGIAASVIMSRISISTDVTKEK